MTMIRPLLIIFVTLAHLPGVRSVGMIAAVTELSFDTWLAVFLKGVLAKGGVPLLSLISGYLAVYSLERYGYFKLLLRKAKRLVWPLFWANLLLILLVTYPTQAVDANFRSDLQIYPFNWLGWFQATFAFYRLPANSPLYFLKDLYACFLLIPILVWLARLKYINVLAIFWMAYKCIYVKTAFIIPVYPIWFFRFDIVFAFYLGILLFNWNKDLLFRNRNLNLGLIVLYLAICSLVSIIYVIYAKPEHITLFLWLDFAVKFFSVLGCIAIMSLLSSNRGWLAGLFTRLSPHSYTLFLTHIFAFTFFNRIYRHYFPAPEFFQLSGSLFVVLILSAAIALAIVLDQIWFGLIERGWKFMRRQV